VFAGGTEDLIRLADQPQHDYAAVRTALSAPWNNGQTGGQVLRLRLIRSQTCGRANLELLRLRGLYRA
jgi:transposase